MTDIVTPEVRSKMMARIKGHNTKIEVSLRKLLFAKGFRYRINVRTLPGRPDLVFPKYRAVIMINGCFWHGHECKLFRLPTSNRQFWEKKISKNRENDLMVLNKLKYEKWRVLTIWECSIRGQNRLGFPIVSELTSDWIKSGKDSDEIKGVI